MQESCAAVCFHTVVFAIAFFVSLAHVPVTQLPSSSSPVLNREGNSLEKPIDVDDLQVEPLSKMKEQYGRKVEFGRLILGSGMRGYLGAQ